MDNQLYFCRFGNGDNWSLISIAGHVNYNEQLTIYQNEIKSNRSIDGFLEWLNNKGYSAYRPNYKYVTFK